MTAFWNTATGSAAMRDQIDDQGDLFYTLNLEKKVPADHPLRKVRRCADQVLRSMNDLPCCTEDTWPAA